jgi:transposase-like protein
VCPNESVIGVRFAPFFALDPKKDLIQEYMDKEISKASISKLLGVNKQTLYSFIKKYKMEKTALS